MTDPVLIPPPNAPAEPLITVATITGIAAAILGGAVAFGLHLSDDQRNALLGIIGVVAPIVVGVWGRARVYSPATVRSLLLNRKHL